VGGYSLYDFLHGYVYARWPYLYIGIGVGEHPLAKKLGPLVGRIAAFVNWISGDPDGGDRASGANGSTFADAYHGKVVPLKAARELVTVNRSVDLPGLEQVIPYKQATDIVLRNPDHIAVIECPCRASRSDPCLPLDVCVIVGEPFTSFVTEHHPERARWISQDEAVQILREEDVRGHVHHAFFKDAMLGRFYAICNCCACCCGAMQAHRNGTPMLASSGFRCQVEELLCIGCEVCSEYCQFDALEVENGYCRVDDQVCMGCGVCVDKCDQGALTLVRDETKGSPLEIFALMDAAVHSEGADARILH
jgi:ferredoxin